MFWMDKQTIWIIPQEPLKKQLEDIVAYLSQKFESPVFEPHMTLLGDVEMERSEFMEKCSKLSRVIEPFPLELGEVSFSTTYFQSVFVRVRSTAPLMEANIKAKEIFGVENNFFMPHISLLYGEHSMETRSAASSNVELREGTAFTADSFVVTQASLEPSEWVHLEELELGSRKTNDYR